MNSRTICALLGISAMIGAVNAHDYAAGQHWSYKTRPGEEKSVVVINLVEQDAKRGAIYHISVLHVNMPTLDGSASREMDLPHSPVSQQTLDDSVIALLETGEPVAAYRQGYEIWKAAFDAGKAGVFKIPVAQIVDFIEATIRKGR
jgi:hypothetical protein